MSGGAILSRSAHASEALRVMEQHARPLPLSVVARYLCYPLIYRKARALYTIGLGRAFLALCKSLQLLIPIVTAKEKRGSMPLLLKQCPNACAALALYSLKQLSQTNAHRRALTALYTLECNERGWNVIPGIQSAYALQKFPLFFHRADALRQSLKREGFSLDDGWTGCIICPRGTDCDVLGYAQGTDVNAEQLGEEILSLPTHPTMKIRQAHRLIHSLASHHDHRAGT